MIKKNQTKERLKLRMKKSKLDSGLWNWNYESKMKENAITKQKNWVNFIVGTGSEMFTVTKISTSKKTCFLSTMTEL